MVVARKERQAAPDQLLTFGVPVYLPSERPLDFGNSYSPGNEAAIRLHQKLFYTEGRLTARLLPDTEQLYNSCKVRLVRVVILPDFGVEVPLE